MPAPIPQRPDILQLNSIISAVVHDPELQGRPYADTIRSIWGRVAEAYVTGALDSYASIREMNALVSLNAEQAQAERQLARAIETYQRTGFDQAIDARMRARDIDTRPGVGFGEPAVDRIRFQIRTDVMGVTTPRWVTWQPGIEGPQTVSELLDQLDEVGAGFAENYGEEYLGLGEGLSLTSV